MNSTDVKTIDDVISVLDQIIADSEKNNDPLGYFAVLYQRVTQKVKEGIKANYFDDGPRMEKLDVVFAKKYLDAYFAWKNNEPVNLSWEKAFLFSKYHWPLVLQHLLLGMNAHINLDLGISAAAISANKNIRDLKIDFYRINEILSLMVNEVQNNLSTIWPSLKKILAKTGKVDNLLVDFSMEIARDGAWEFAEQISTVSEPELVEQTRLRDEKIAPKTQLITHPKPWMRILLWIIRLGETGAVSDKIKKLKAKTENAATVPLQQ